MIKMHNEWPCFMTDTLDGVGWLTKYMTLWLKLEVHLSLNHSINFKNMPYFLQQRSTKV